MTDANYFAGRSWLPTDDLLEHHLIIQRLVARTVEGESVIGHQQRLAGGATGLVEEVHGRNLAARESEGGFDRFEKNRRLAVIQRPAIHGEVFESAIAVAGDGANQRALRSEERR